MASVKIERLQKKIKQDVARILQFELSDPRIGFLTVTRVELSKDLRHARVFVSMLGDEAQRRTAFRGLESARGLIQGSVARGLRTRVTPEIAFQFDPSVERAARISSLIDKIAAEREARARGEEPGALENSQDELEHSSDEIEARPGGEE